MGSTGRFESNPKFMEAAEILKKKNCICQSIKRSFTALHTFRAIAEKNQMQNIHTSDTSPGCFKLPLTSYFPLLQLLDEYVYF